MDAMPPAHELCRMPRLPSPSSDEQQSAVVSTIASKDGLRLAIGTGAGSIGVLDVASHGYTTALRSHRGGITAVAVDPNEEQQEFSTVSEDCTIRCARRFGCKCPERLSSRRACPVVVVGGGER